jgi:hypothetical protein
VSCFFAPAIFYVVGTIILISPKSFILQLAFFVRFGFNCLTNKIISSYRIFEIRQIGMTKTERDLFPGAALARFAVSRVPELSAM